MSQAQSYSLESLLDTLTKQASEESGETKKEELKEEVANGSKSKAEAAKEEKEGQEKSASEAGAALAKEVFEKVAHINKENQMNKQASYAGKALADAILTKLASAGDQATENGIPAGVVPNKNQADAALLVAQDNAKYQATPGTDGAGNGGSVNQIFDAIVQDAVSEGAVAYDQTHAQAAGAQEGAATEQGSFLGQVPTDESQEKMAACLTLVENGVDFDSAVALVKEAEEAIWAEEDGQIKQAAVGELLEQGFDFDTAVGLIKEAYGKGYGEISEAEARKFAAANGPKVMKDHSTAGVRGSSKATPINSSAAGEYTPNARARAMGVINDLKAGAGDFSHQVAGLGLKGKRMASAGMLARNPAVRAAAGALGVAGAAGYALTREKKAAFDALVDAGVDFEKAAELVATKSYELYGA